MSRIALTAERAADCLRQGRVIAYPTEAVWGLGCDPFNAAAVQRLLDVKQRPAAKGMIVIAADVAQALPHLHWDELSGARRDEILASWPGPNTWLIPCRAHVPEWLRGEHDTLAVRVTGHAVASSLCRAFGGVVVSTSANRSGEAPARVITDLPEDVLAQLDGWIDGATDGRAQPSTIRDARSGAVVRPG
ncbi:Sua5/YciO/YrdC/YwlC family protein [Xanthomonadaceae bacterium JHOS43]|nr:Sua5/YciO/YrdC/YwlC family protein [Xanthomonadaceae bacterium JHOS43]